MVVIAETLLHTIRQYKMLPPSSRVIVAVSGGVDSVALLHALYQNRSRLPIAIHAATLDHGLRPEASMEVQAVVAMAEKWEIPITAGRVETRTLAAKWSIGTEAAARRARYEFLANVAQEQGAVAIMTAHHADDQAETVLLHLLRGSGVDGLRGMLPVATVPDFPELFLLRPLLPVTRAQLEAYCHDQALTYFHDPSNDDVRYIRNRIRHEILPSLETVNPQMRSNLLRLADIVALESDFLQSRTTEFLQQYAVQQGTRFGIVQDRFAQEHPAIQRRILLDAVRRYAVEVEWKHIIQAQLVALQGATGSISQFPDGIRMRVAYDMLWFELAHDPLPEDAYFLIHAEVQLLVPGNTPLANLLIVATHEPQENRSYMLAVDPDAPVFLRTRRPGDRFQPAGMGGKSRKLKDWMIDRKIPQHLRDRIPLMVQHDQIIAILLPTEWALSQSLISDVISQHYFYFSVRRL
jgi:tRNA(Ile)-lysidine synthase